ncbi:unnamed protein product [Paramecium sonneborni]|uniref:Uncharacterized protein n=1 Tax=Paramecium sonneborni TaxID=65129 RepID=A0A8S1RF89_9CILI|nr:unnamed protein product [Paramecium sonneborni]
MIDLTVNLNNEKDSNENVSQYLQSLNTIICDMHILFQQFRKLDQLQEVLIKYRQKIREYLINIVKENTQLEVYLQSIHEGQSHIEKYNFNQDCINENNILSIDKTQILYQYPFLFSVKLSIDKENNSSKLKLKLRQTLYFYFGMTRVGKSMIKCLIKQKIQLFLINISKLNNPENIIIILDNKYLIQKTQILKLKYLIKILVKHFKCNI